MKKKSFKTINIAAAVIFAAAFFLNLQANLGGGLEGFLGQPLIAQGTGSGGSGTGSGTGSGSGSGSGGSGSGCPQGYVPDMMLKTVPCIESEKVQIQIFPPKFKCESKWGSKFKCDDKEGVCCDPTKQTLCKDECDSN